MAGDDIRAGANVLVSWSAAEAFDRFIDLNAWWPRIYTWSGAALVALRLDPKAGGLLSEIGPHGFRCDFGRVLAIERPRRLTLAWHIGATRAPQPDPASASEVDVRFTPEGANTRVTLVQRYFEKHGGDYKAYADAMRSEAGWPYLLQAYAEK